MKSPTRSDRSRRRRLGLSAIPLVAVAVLVLTMTAFASAGSAMLGVANAKVGSHQELIAVNSKGVAVYELSPERAGHLLCTSSSCLSVWPPVKVSAGVRLTKAAGLKGRLGKLRRTGFTQLTLDGHPLYTFAEDGGQRGVATGNGLHSFGGTWFVFPEGAAHSIRSSSGSSTGSSGSSGW